MVARHDAGRQKKLAKHKAKRAEKRARESRHNSKDPSVRLQGVERWPVVKSLVSSNLWKAGIGHLVIAREEGKGRLVYAVFLVDVYCLGVKNAFWGAGSMADFDEMVRRMNETQMTKSTSPACLAKIIEGAVAYAGALGFPPHPDYRHSARLLAGIDPAECDQEFTFGRDGKPFYIQGPNESPMQAQVISQRVKEAGGDWMVVLGPDGPGHPLEPYEDDDDYGLEDEELLD